jgi:hypothetical protein
MRRWLLLLAIPIVATLAGCVPPLQAPGTTSTITLISSTTDQGYRFDYYRNTAYPCSISGYQTFTIAAKVGQSPTQTKPLWVFMHGGGTGYFDEQGTPQPDSEQMTQESAARQRAQLEGTALTRRITTLPADFRFVSVSMCNRDLYGGPNIPDPNNPNTTPDGEPRTVNGLYATKAAVQFALAKYPTDDYFLYGASAGAAGTFHVAWALQQQGLAPAGLVADSGVMNTPAHVATRGLCAGTEDEGAGIFRQRLHPDVADPANNPDLLVSSGRLTVPVFQVWTINDLGQCGDTPVACPLRDGTSPTLGAVDCVHEPLRRAIAAQGPATKSASMRLCVDSVERSPQDCDLHMPTVHIGAVNTLPGAPADFNAVIVDWVGHRLADD